MKKLMASFLQTNWEPMKWPGTDDDLILEIPEQQAQDIFRIEVDRTDRIKWLIFNRIFKDEYRVIYKLSRALR